MDKYYETLQDYILNTTFDEVECNDYEIDFTKRYCWATVIIQIFKDGHVAISKLGARGGASLRRSWQNNGKFTIWF